MTHSMILAALLAAALQAAGAELRIEEVAPGNYVHYGTHEERTQANLGDQANIGFIVGQRCVAVIDTGGSLPLGAALRDAIRRITPLPVCYVVLTHAHPDHFFGAAAFGQDRPQYVGHAELPRALAARGKFYRNTLLRDLGELAQGSTVVTPTLLVSDRVTLDLGERDVEVRAWPVAHTDNDLTVYDGRTQTLWLSDLLFIDHTPVVDGSILGFVQVIGILSALPARHYVAGHGRSPLRWPEVLDAQRQYLNRLVEETRQALRHGKTIQEAVDSVGQAQSGNWINFELFHRRNVTATYTELEWED
jgi:quinoprotein relay system zinc metallohydrolase 2